MIVIRYSPESHNPIDLQKDGFRLSEIGKEIVQNALKTGNQILVNDPYRAQACEIMARYLKIDFQFQNSQGEVIDQSKFYRIFAAPMRELDLIRSDVDEFIAGGEDPFSDEVELKEEE